MPRALIHNTEFQRAIDRIGWRQIDAADFFRTDRRTIRRYASGELNTPAVVTLLLRLIVNANLKSDGLGRPDEPLNLLLRLIFDLKLDAKQFSELVEKKITGRSSLYVIEKDD